MRKYKSFLSKFLLLEAIPLSDIKKMIKGWDKNRHADWFNNKFRVYLPLEKSIPKEELKSPVETDIETKLSNEGYEIENYKDGIVINKKQGNRIEKKR